MTVRLLADSDRSPSPDIWCVLLDAFISAVDAVDANDPFSCCEQAWDIWENSAIADPPSEAHPAMLIVLGVRQALASVMASAYRNTTGHPLTVADAHASLSEELNAVRRECERWRQEGLPSAAEVRARSATAVTGLHTVAKRSA